MAEQRSTPDRIASYGRGGAGNIGKEDPTTHMTHKDLVTPTLKSDHYSTGRGGSGNMAKNDPNHPEIARAAQDVEAVAHHEPEGPHHYGRGGAANIVRQSGEENRAVLESDQRTSEDVRHEEGAAGKSLVDKGKGFLQKLGVKK
ncbi:hypothetical protein BU23DRAFT_580014 [Bimuria novae-zelandiae CBS 107.79]|uniref:Uncharacterized protein n=1 Tax=Bimuria novae-zelandiae CBS 107.79 TaxID=1447943 RepID=A0A6A5VCJ7_9PLEO|nr:hypothetical protein BU23DRAFT_580014 [Bimuria novae-zelandiae CBS 107.79]